MRAMNTSSCSYSYSLILTFFLLSTALIQALEQENSPKTQNSGVDPYELLHIIPNSDGTITRIKQYYPTVPPNTSINLAFSKDTPLNPKKNTWARLYLPKNSNLTRPESLPVVVYAHGGGFILLSAATPNFDNFCAHAAAFLNVLVVSVEYRLAPEHRLPAAYEDVLEALYWLKDKKDEWVSKYGDVSKCILMGESAGGNIAYNVGLQASFLADNIKPVIVKGLVLIQPFFGGSKRSGSELRLDASRTLPLAVTDLMWNLSLPIGETRDYVYCNPFVDGSSRVKRVRELGWRVAVVGCDGDPLFDRQVEVTNWLKEQGVDVVGEFSKGDYHGVYVTEFDKAEKFFQFVRSVFSPYLVT